jgi:7-carboxy-7-deazaguanine synthase
MATAPMPSRLLINEIFHSIQGESTYAGLPCIFVRLRGCHLRCAWCDTTYAFNEGAARSVSDVLREVLAIPTDLVEITGGEPLLQQPVHELMSSLCDAGRTVLLETSGACDISVCDPRVIRIMDLKPPGSGECGRNDMANIDRLQAEDEVKFVIGDRDDYDWSVAQIQQHNLADRVSAILLSPVYETAADSYITGHAGLEPSTLAAWMLEDGIPARLQTQMHKSIWHPTTRGV